MSLKDTLLTHLRSFHTAPFLFVGSGLSRRYLGLDDWTSLLKRMSALTGRPYEYYRASGDGKEPAIASEIARDLHVKWWDSDDFDESRERFKADAINKESAFKIEAAKYIEAESFAMTDDPDLVHELDLLREATIDGVITTNWDLLIENIFPDFRVFIGQERLLFSAPQSIGEIYKIHGCCTEPNSLVVTSGDYARFNDRNPYLASKLLTIFVEHPVIFLGYSLNDPNVSEILLSIASCLTTENIDQLRDRLILVQWAPDCKHYSINDTSIVAGGYNIPVKVILTPNFVSIFEALRQIPRKFPAQLLRKLKKHVYNLVQDNDPDNHLYVADIEDDADLSTLDVVFGVGVKLAEGIDVPGAIRLSNNPDAPAFQLTTDSSAPKLPYQAPTSTDPYTSVQEEFVGALRAWKTNPDAYVPKSELWDFYRARLSLDLNREGLQCLLVSSMHQNGPYHYWASRLGREEVHRILKAEVEKDQFPGIQGAARLAFAVGMSQGEDILDAIGKRSQYSSARDQAKRLREAMAQGYTPWKEYRSPAATSIQYGGEKLEFNIYDLRDDEAAINELITKLVDFGKKGRAAAKRLDALFFGSKL